MAKLNYLNRKSEGVKLGSIVAKDLRKRCKTPGSKARTHEDTSPIEIMLEAKNLTDEGLREVADGLKDALAQPETTRVVVLTLARNGLTAQSLSSLAKPLRLACTDLEELDLSNNNISVSSEQEARAFEDFLDALKGCGSLKKLNMSGNQLGGGRVFEVFAKVYLRHFTQNVVNMERSLEEDEGVCMDGEINAVSEHIKRLALSPTKKSRVSSSGLQRPLLSGFAARGLATVQSIDFSNSGITDQGALWLSYVIPKHNWTVQRLHGLDGHLEGPPSNGIICLPGDHLTAMGSKLLLQAACSTYDSFIMTEIPSVYNAVLSTRQATHSPNHRRKLSHDAAETTLNTSPIKHDSVEELESSRRKLQRTMLQDAGAKSALIWSTALKLLAYTRHIMIDTSRETSCPPRPALSSPSRGANGIRENSPPHTTYASRLIVNPNERADALLSITDTSDTPVKPVIFRARKRRDSFSVGSDCTAPSQSSQKVTAVALKAPISMDTGTVRMIGPMPEKAWQIVLGMLVDERGVLSQRHRRAIIDYGSDRGTLAAETEALGKAQSVQMWMVLESMGCLKYDGEN